MLLEREPKLEDVSAAAALAQVWAVYIVVMLLVAPATEAHWAEADPILGILPRGISLSSVPLASLAAAAVWWRVAKPSRDALRRGLLFALAGLTFGLCAVGLMRLAVGPELPSFIPAEESAGPGFALSMTAGYAEEVIFRFALLPVLYFGLRERLPKLAAAVVAALITGLGFALLHDAGPGAFDPAYFVTRTLMPGFVFSVVFLKVSPSFLVTAHASAHLLIPALFV